MQVSSHLLRSVRGDPTDTTFVDVINVEVISSRLGALDGRSRGEIGTGMKADGIEVRAVGVEHPNELCDGRAVKTDERDIDILEIGRSNMRVEGQEVRECFFHLADDRFDGHDVFLMSGLLTD